MFSVLYENTPPTADEADEKVQTTNHEFVKGDVSKIPPSTLGFEGPGPRVEGLGLGEYYTCCGYGSFLDLFWRYLIHLT